jgi:hypothetical protein
MTPSIFFSERAAPVFSTSFQMRGTLNIAFENFFQENHRQAKLLVLGVRKFLALAKEVLSPAQQLEAEQNPLAVRMAYRDAEILLDLKDPERTDIY